MEPESYLNGLNDEDLRIRASAIIALGLTGDRNAIKQLTEILENKNEVDWLRGCAAIALGRLSGEEVLSPLIRALQDESLMVCRAVISAMGELKSPKVLPYLEEVLHNQGKKELHAAAVSIMGAAGGEEVVSIMLQALEHPETGVRCNAALALGNLRTEKAIQPLVKLMQEKDESLRAVAASSLGLIGDSRAAPILIAALNDCAETVRAIAASSLGYMNSREAIPFLEKALEDNNINVRKQAANALLKLKSNISLKA
jgi:HEAT repeat protein